MNTDSCLSFNSAANVSESQNSCIRATFSRKEEIQPTLTTMPCQHCLDEKYEKERRLPRVRLCYYCHQPSHQIYSCKSKENDEATQLINQAVNDGIQGQESEAVCRDEMIVTGTEGGQWGDIWYASSTFPHHYAGNLNVFKRIKHLVGVETKSEESNFLFIWGIGAVEIKSSNEMLRIQSVFYTPELDRNVLSMNQLTFQGYTVSKTGDTCKIFSMFSAPVMNTVDDTNGLTKEEELGLKEKQRVLELNDVNEKYKENYLDSYFQDLNISSQEPDWSLMIIRAMEFHDFTDCKSLLEIMEDSKFVFKYKQELEGKFKEMLSWFITVKLGISTRPIPPYAAGNKKVDLLRLYMVVERDGGYRNVTDNNIWSVIAKDMGYEYHDSEFMRIIYAMYLDVLVYYYRFKKVQGKAIDKEMIRESESSSAGCHERRMSADVVQDEAAMEHYALYDGNDWEGAFKMEKKRRRFDFKQAIKAVDEANQSVLMYTTKHNQV